ncbi:MAG: hypothetical protein M9916_12245 [Crocinitomicaceae bacterium]|nr:hypothetical protein [Crocinitomicaceae bacterium]
MLRYLFTFTMLLAFNSNAQSYYSYSFSGAVSDFEQLESKMMNIEGVQSCKTRYKDEKQAGELIFQLKKYEKEYDEKGNFINPSPLINIKNLLFKEGLEPIELVEINN